jgi:hypothetical protein
MNIVREKREYRPFPPPVSFAFDNPQYACFDECVRVYEYARASLLLFLKMNHAVLNSTVSAYRPVLIIVTIPDAVIIIIIIT